ncbi:MAG: pilus assembly PilX N-terminal domain-containing protein [Deltaproteobacteria bacterium]|nr:pilus assembly PilX N-terminal domain-containing protein [Deltaproteobacteria bacterium]MBW2153168.1 pilus assembly PilX N-terminal domain-containing protein [Deltaproteobacteria bacterium]
MKANRPYHNEKGIALITSLLFMAIVSILGTTAYLTASNEMTISSNYRLAKKAFYDAEAGVNYTLAGIEAALADGSLNLTGDSVSVNYAAPSGFSFDTVTTLTRVSGTSNYQFQVTGNAAGGRCTLEVVIARDSVLQFGVFGDEEVDMKSNASVYSYDSRTTANPTPDDSTHEADVGSNEKVVVHNGTNIDGNVGLGAQEDGTDAVLDSTGTPTIYGSTQDLSRVDPDPMGAVGGSLAADFITYSASNDNASAGIAGDIISLGNGESLTLEAGNYYLTDITLHNGATLQIDAGLGPVNIYLTGGLEAKNGSSVNITGLPTEFTIFSNSTDKIVLKHGGTFKGTIYAPYAEIEMKNGSDAYGLLWGKTIDIKNSGEFYFDTALKEKWLANTVSVVSWKDTRY